MPNLKFINTFLYDWYQQPLGQALAEIESTELTYLLQGLPARKFLQVGDHPVRLAKIRKAMQFVTLHQELKQNQPLIQSDYAALPLPTDYFDVVALLHAIELKASPEATLQEAWRVLMPEGHLVILGFNPWSSWGIKRTLSSSQSDIPWKLGFHNPYRIKRYLQKLGGEFISLKYFFYRPPLQNASILDNLSWLDKSIPWIAPQIGATYILVAQKHVLPLTPLKPKWRWQPLFGENKGLIPTGAGTINRG